MQNATPPLRNASCCFSKGLPKQAKTHSKTTSYTSAFSTLKRRPPSFDFAPTWLPLGPPKAPPRGLQGLLKTTLGSILGHLGCKFQFVASQGVPPGHIFLIFDHFLKVCTAGFVLNVVSTPFTNGAFVVPTAFATTLDFQLLIVTIGVHDCPFELVFGSTTCKTAHCRGGLGEAHVNPPWHKSLVYATAGVSGYL